MGGAGRVSGPFWPQPETAPAAAPTAPTAMAQARHATVLAAKLDFDFQGMRRILMSTAPASSALSDLQYQQQTSDLLARIESTADRWLQDDVVDIDTQRTGGLLEMSFPDGSKIIVNTQPPLHEVWLATRAGGYHYRWLDGTWRDTRDGSEFFSVLSGNASAQAGRALDF